MTDMQLSIIRQSLLHELGQLQAAAPNDATIQRVSKATTAFYGSLTDLTAQLADIEADPHLTTEGKRAQKEEAKAAWKERAGSVPGELAASIEQALTNAQLPSLPAPEVEPLLLEAKLSNARADVRMYLDPVSTNDLPRRMRELIEHNADPTITYLLLATTWGEHYLRSRTPANSKPTEPGRQAIYTHLLEWAHIRQELTRQRLPETERRAWDTQTAKAKTLPRVAPTITATIDHTMRTAK